MKQSTVTEIERTILIIDDDEQYLNFIAQHLRQENFHVLTTRSTSTACKWVRERKISVVLCDWYLGEMKPSLNEPPTGSDLLRKCREIDPFLPFIVMSGAPQYDARSDSIMLEADSFIQKPFSLTLLTKHLRRWILRAEGEKNPFHQLSVGFINTIDAVNRAYIRAVVERVGSVLQAAPKLGLSRQTVASYLESDPQQ